jgi:hypothetical protein
LSKRGLKAGKPAIVMAHIVSEMEPSSIPANPLVNLEALKSGDDDPLEVVVEIPAGKSKRGWNYTTPALQDVVNKVNAQATPGYLGHMTPEEVSHKFPTPVTHWVGAKLEGGKAYVRGVVDKAAGDLKRWIRAGVVNTTSILGTPKLATVAGEVQVQGFDLISNDWTPPGRAGMATRLVGVGEMEEYDYEDYKAEMIGDGSHEDLREAIRTAALEGSLGASYIYVRRVYDDYAIIEAEVKEAGGNQLITKLYQLPYGTVDDKIQLGTPVEVVEKRVYEPATTSEMDHGGEGSMTWQEALKKALESKTITVEQAIAEMAALGIKPTAEAVDLSALGVTSEMDNAAIIAQITAAGEALTKQLAEASSAIVDEAIKAKVAGEVAQYIVRDKLAGKIFATKDAVMGEIDAITGAESFKELLAKLHAEPGSGVAGAGQPVYNGVAVRRVAL